MLFGRKSNPVNEKVDDQPDIPLDDTFLDTKEGTIFSHHQLNDRGPEVASDSWNQYPDEAIVALYEHGEEKYKRLGWKRLTVILIVEAVAIGSLSIPAAFATLGMIPGIIITVGIGIIAIYTSWIIGQIKLQYPQIASYSDAGYEAFGKWGRTTVDIMLALQLVFSVSSHCLTGTIAFNDIVGKHVCAVVWGVVSMIILLVLAIPPSFAEMAILGFIDFGSILAAIGITIISTGVETSNSPGGFSAVPWSLWPSSDTSFASAFSAVANILFAYSFAICQFSFMDEMHTPEDFPKATLSLGIIEIFIYTVTGSVVYAFVGDDVGSPALLSAGTTISRVAFGVALPVIFISGSINTTVLGRMIHGRIYKDSHVRFINSPKGWLTWLTIVLLITVLAFIIAEVIPFFSDLLSLASSLFISGFTFYLPGVFWYVLLHRKSGQEWTMGNIAHAIMCIFCFLIGILTLGAGSYASISSIADQFNSGSVNGVFSCKVSS